MGFLQKLLTNRVAGNVLREIAGRATDLEHFRRLVGERAAAGDLDAVYGATVEKTQRKLKDYIEKG